MTLCGAWIERCTHDMFGRDNIRLDIDLYHVEIACITERLCESLRQCHGTLGCQLALSVNGR